MGGYHEIKVANGHTFEQLVATGIGAASRAGLLALEELLRHQTMWTIARNASSKKDIWRRERTARLCIPAPLCTCRLSHGRTSTHRIGCRPGRSEHPRAVGREAKTFLRPLVANDLQNSCVRSGPCRCAASDIPLGTGRGW